jgi:hypothetical protein
MVSRPAVDPARYLSRQYIRGFRVKHTCEARLEHLLAAMGTIVATWGIPLNTVSSLRHSSNEGLPRRRDADNTAAAEFEPSATISLLFTKHRHWSLEVTLTIPHQPGPYS